MTKQLLKQTKNYSLWLVNSSEIIFRNETPPIKEDISIYFSTGLTVDRYFHKFISIQQNGAGWIVGSSNIHSSFAASIYPLKLSAILKTVLNHYCINATAKTDNIIKANVHIIPKTNKDRAKFLFYFGSYIKQRLYDKCY